MTHNYAKKFAVTIKHVQARRLGEDIADMSPPQLIYFHFDHQNYKFLSMSPTLPKIFVVYKFMLVPPPNIGHATALNMSQTFVGVFGYNTEHNLFFDSFTFEACFSIRAFKYAFLKLQLCCEGINCSSTNLT